MLSPHRGALIRKCCFEQSAAGLTAHAGPDSLAGTEMEGAVQKSGTRASQNGRCIPILGVDHPAERYPADFDRDSHRVLAARCDGADEAGAVLAGLRIRRQAFSVDASRSRNTDAACTAATFTVP